MLYRFGQFLFDADQELLFRCGLIIPLKPKATRALLLLLESHGRVVSKEFLIRELWGDAFVEENNLSQCITALRKALGDDRNGNAYIQTLTKKGYRFVMPVTVETASSTALNASQAVENSPGGSSGVTPSAVDGVGQERPSAAAAVPEASDGDFAAKAGVDSRRQISGKDTAATDRQIHARPSRRTKWPYVLAAAGALVSAAALIVTIFVSRQQQAPVITAVRQLTHDRLEKYPWLRTDGSRIYFCEGGPQDGALSYVPVEGGDTFSVPSPFPSIAYYDISHTGSKLLFGSPELGGLDTALWIMPLDRRSPRRVGEILASSAAWSPDGSRIAYAAGTSLYTASPDGRGVRRVATLPDTPGHIHWSPDGRRLRFDIFSGNPPKALPWEIAANGSGLRRILPGWDELGGYFLGDWTLDGRHYVFSVFQTIGAMNVETLWAMRASGGPLALFGRDNPLPVQLGADSRSYYAPVSSPDARKLFVMGEERSGELVRYDGRNAEFVPYLNRLDGRWVTFSPDGRWVTYTKYSDGTLWCMHPDGSGKKQLTFAPFYTDGIAWSSDDKWIALHAQTTRGAHFNIYLLPAPGHDGGAGAADPPEPKMPLQLLPADNEDRGIPTWSPDNQRIGFGEMDGPTSEQGSGKEVIHICDLATRHVSVLPGKRGVWTARWSPNGRWLAALTYDRRQRLELYDFKTRTWRDLDADHINNPTWSHDSRYIYYDVNAGTKADVGIFRVRISDGKVELAAAYHGMRVADHTWSGLAPDDSPIVLRDVGIQEIYALSVKWP